MRDGKRSALNQSKYAIVLLPFLLPGRDRDRDGTYRVGPQPPTSLQPVWSPMESHSFDITTQPRGSEQASMSLEGGMADGKELCTVAKGICAWIKLARDDESWSQAASAHSARGGPTNLLLVTRAGWMVRLVTRQREPPQSRAWPQQFVDAAIQLQGSGVAAALKPAPAPRGNPVLY